MNKTIKNKFKLLIALVLVALLVFLSPLSAVLSNKTFFVATGQNTIDAILQDDDLDTNEAYTNKTLADEATSRYVGKAYADEAADAAVSDAQRKVEETATTYNALNDKVSELELQIEENQSRIEEIQQELPAQRKASNSSLVAMYKMQQEGSSLLDMLLSSGSVMEFIENLDYLDRIQSKHMEAVIKLCSMEEELTQTYNELSQARSDVEQQRSDAQTALTAAQEARAVAQAEAERKKQEEAEAEAAAVVQQQQQQQQQQQAQAQAQQQTTQTPADANTGSTVANESTQETNVNAPVSSDKADWGEDKQAFVNAWAGRINNYLSGSPLAGQGETFASAAWDYGVDPRWSPAISYVESSKGAVCFLDYNAWGWGSSSWDSWEEAINAHVRGLSRGYGYTLSMEAAKKYCPPNWQHWYNSCAAQMEMI